MEFLEKNFNRLYWLVCCLVFVLIALRAYYIPFSHDEASTFFFYVQSGEYLPYKSHVYTNNHILNSALSSFCYQLGGSHRFVLRIPNLLAFFVMCYGVFRFFSYLKQYSSKIFLIGFFVFTFNFLDFFEMCRGYGLSMAFLILGLSYLQSYFNGKRFIFLLLFSFSLQLALSANLILVVILSFLIGVVFVFQIKEKLFFRIKNILLQSINIWLLYKWIKLSFYYRREGVLDSGSSVDYWNTTFVSLINMIYGLNAAWLKISIVVAFILAIFITAYVLIRYKLNISTGLIKGLLYVFALLAFIAGFYLQNKLLGVNFPEDRTALFFYVFFALSIVFANDQITYQSTWVLASVFTLLNGIYLISHMNLKSFTHYFYQVIPKEVISYLENEYKLNGNRAFSIGGNISREMNYAFLNYRGGGQLNPMRTSSEMTMNCDYYFASKLEAPYYKNFYDEVVQDEIWNRVLLKRKTPLHRKPLLLDSLSKYYKGTDAYFEFARPNDSLFHPGECVEVDITLFFKNVPKPFKSFLVLNVDNEEYESVYYERAILYWLEHDLNNKKRTIKLTTGVLPKNFKSVYLYLWNIEQEPIEFSVHGLNIFTLHGKGANFKVPEEFYPLIEKVTKKPML